jgi:hypothetical protein
MQPVINLPPPTVIVQQPPVIPAAKPTAASRIWSVAKVGGPAVISVAALLTSLLTYTDQHEVDQAAAATTLRHDAEQISFTSQVIHGPPPSIAVTIVNSSASLISFASIIVQAADADPADHVPGPLLKTFALELDQLRPCSTGVVEANSVLAKLMKVPQSRADHITYIPESMTFMDRYGQIWTTLNTGLLEPASTTAEAHLLTISPANYVTVRFSPAQGCS